MTKNFKNPNDEVEGWKDKIYERTKHLAGKELAEYYEQRTKEILEKYNLKIINNRFVSG